MTDEVQQVIEGLRGARLSAGSQDTVDACTEAIALLQGEGSVTPICDLCERHSTEWLYRGGWRICPACFKKPDLDYKLAQIPYHRSRRQQLSRQGEGQPVGALAAMKSALQRISKEMQVADSLGASYRHTQILKEIYEIVRQEYDKISALPQPPPPDARKDEVCDLAERAVVALHMHFHAGMTKPEFGNCRKDLCGDWHALAIVPPETYTRDAARKDEVIREIAEHLADLSDRMSEVVARSVVLTAVDRLRSLLPPEAGQ